MIINTSFFIVSDVNVPNVSVNTDPITGNQNSLQWYIDVYEREVLIKGLGRELYELFIANIEQDQNDPEYGNLLPGSPQRFIDLLDGVQYTISGDTFFWNGLRFTIDTSLQPVMQSLIAYYVFYKYVNDNVENLTNLGVAVEKVKNAAIVDPTKLMIDAWRNFYNMYQSGHFNGRRSYYHNGFNVADYSGFNNTQEVSLWKFLSDNSDDYPEWRFTPCEQLNQFGI